MSNIRQALRNRFQKVTGGDKTDVTSDGLIYHNDSIRSTSSANALNQLGSSQSSLINDQEITTFLEDSLEDDEKSCEANFTNIQEQLMSVLLENQRLSSELAILKEGENYDLLFKELETEKQRNRVLSQEVKRLVEVLERDSNRISQCDIETLADNQNRGDIDVAKGVTKMDVGIEIVRPRKLTMFRIVMERLLRFYWDLYDDFTLPVDITEKSESLDPEGDPLAIKKLKENLVRFSHSTKPIRNVIYGTLSLLRWENPATTFVVFMIYMYTVYHGWFIPMMLYLFTFRLLINYLKHKGWNIEMSYLQKMDSEEFQSKELKMSDKFALILQVARKVQNKLGLFADGCEKSYNLFLWHQPEITGQLFFALCTFSLLFTLFPIDQLSRIFGLLLGLKLFLVDYLFYRFPRLKAKYDSTAQLWERLPTDADIERLSTFSKSDSQNEIAIPQSQSVGLLSSLQSITNSGQSISELFHLPVSELPVLSWETGRRCTLINRDKGLSSVFKNGRLYLTEKHLCFERSKTFASKNLVIPLGAISKIHKAKLYQWIPGGGMAIEITLDNSEKPYIFAAMLMRDEAYDSMIEVGRRCGYTWADISEGSSIETSPSPSTSLLSQDSVVEFKASDMSIIW